MESWIAPSSAVGEAYLREKVGGALPTCKEASWGKKQVDTRWQRADEHVLAFGEIVQSESALGAGEGSGGDLPSVYQYHYA